MKKTIHIHSLFLTFLLLPFFMVAQGFEWAKQVEVLDVDLIASVGWTTHDVEKDVNGNIYIAGNFSGTQKFGDSILTSSGTMGIPPNPGIPTDDGFLVKYSPSGEFLWVETFPSSLTTTIRDIEVDDAGNIYVYGSFMDNVTVGGTLIESESDEGLMLAKLSPNLELLWLESYIQVNTFNSISPYHMEINNDAVFITGTFDNGATVGGTVLENPYQFGDPLFIASLDQQSGGLNWVNIAGIRGWSGVGEMGVDEEGNVFLATSSTGNYQLGGATINAPDKAVLLLIKYDAQGNLIWLQKSNYGNFFGNAVNEIDINQNGEIFLTGQWGDTLSFGNIEMVSPPIAISGKLMWIGKFNTLGEPQWIRTSGIPSNYLAITEGLNVDVSSDGGVFVAGTYGNGEMSLGEGSNEVLLSFDGLGYIAKYDNDGNLSWAQKLMCSTIGCLLNVKGMTAVGPNQVAFTGIFQDVFELGDVTLNAVYPSTVSQPNIYVIKLDGDIMSTSVDNITIGSQFKVSPNPTSHFFQLEIQNSDQFDQINIYDLNGKLLYQTDFKENNQQININQFPSGTYIISLKGKENLAHQKLIITR